MKWKLYGGRRRISRWITVPLLILLLLECLYLCFVYSGWAPIAHLRSLTIQTSMSTMRHQWIAKTMFPQSAIDEAMQPLETARVQQINVISHWEAPETVELPSDAEEAFYASFPELERNSVSAWLKQNVPAPDWERLCIDESGLTQSGTEMRSAHGDPVLAIDAENGVTLLRITGIGWRGVLAIAHDPSRLTIEPSALLESGYGQTAGEISQAHGGVLAITASGFMDEDGVSTGSEVCGYAMSNGHVIGTDPLGYGYKRLELRADDRLYLMDSGSPVSADCTNAVEFSPALIIDGNVVVDGTSIWTALNPRACIGQRSDGAILMLCIEGRQVTSIGTTVIDCADVLAKYGAVQAMNLDGGTSAILWYRGKYVTRCSNAALPEGRTLPNAFVYKGAN